MRIKTPKGTLVLPVLYRQTANGKIQKWKVWSSGDQVFTEFGLLGGKKQKTVGKRCSPTNEGRSNERNGAAQAVFEAEAMWRHRIERKYRLSLEEIKLSPVIFPMLAQDYWPKKKGSALERELSPPAKRIAKAKKAVFVQRKLNGVRCMARWVEGELVLFSRQGKRYKVPHISSALEKLVPKHIALDGEIYVHGLPLQKINSLVKDYREESKVLEYHCYDLYNFDDPDSEQRDRLNYLDDILAISDLPIVMVPRKRAATPYDIIFLEQKYVEEGYEGAIVRTMDGKYRLGSRSPDLLKVKSFDDAEFEVLRVKEGRGKFEGCAIFVCRNDINRKKFKVAAHGTLEDRAEAWKRRKKFPGRKYTVRFKGRTEDGIPFHPVGIAFRDKKDLPS